MPVFCCKAHSSKRQIRRFASCVTKGERTPESRERLRAFTPALAEWGTCSAAHITKLNSPLSAIGWSTALANPNFPLVNPLEPASVGGAQQVVVAELDPAGANLLFSTEIGSGGRDSMETHA